MSAQLWKEIFYCHPTRKVLNLKKEISGLILPV
jgi:hypothetical protein